MDGNETAHKKSFLTADQLQRIEENRKKALEKLQQRRIGSPVSVPTSRQQIISQSPVSTNKYSSTYTGAVIRGTLGENQSDLNYNRTSCIIAKQIEEKRAEALERLKRSRGQQNKVFTKSPETCAQFYSTGSPNSHTKNICQTYNSPAKAINNKTNLVDWKDKFSYQKQKTFNSPIRSQNNDTLKSSSLIAKINEESRKRVHIFTGDKKEKENPSSQKAGKFWLLFQLTRMQSMAMAHPRET